MNAKNGIVQLADDTMHYIRFGRGSKTLVILPGLGDGLTTVKGTVLPMALMYRTFIRAYTVYMFSRRNTLAQGSTTRDMARDLKEALDVLGIERIDLIGVSMGGMIAQHFAADHPERLGKLVLVVTAPAPNPTLTGAVSEWIALTKRGDHTAFMDSSVRLMYSIGYYRRNRWLIPIMGRFTKPASYDRFFIQAQACLTHDATDRLKYITAPTLVIGGGQDRTLSPEASHQLASAIPSVQLRMYLDWGHGLYEEAKDFQQVVLDFLTTSSPLI